MLLKYCYRYKQFYKIVIIIVYTQLFSTLGKSIDLILIIAFKTLVL